MKELYEQIFRRRSFRDVKGFHMSVDEMNGIAKKIKELHPLDDSIKTMLKIMPAELTTAHRGEICVELYSEKKDGYLLNAGYMLQQLELYLCSKNIGSCWMGMARPDSDTCHGLDYVIMLACSKITTETFRGSSDDFDRKSINEICEGNVDTELAEAVRLAPSACNTQCWHIKGEGNKLSFYRNSRIKSIIPPEKLEFFNTIDMGIALCHAEIALEKKEIDFKRTLFSPIDNDGRVKVAEYLLRN